MKKLLFALFLFASLASSAQEKIEMLLWNPEAKDVKLDVKDLTRDPGVTVYRPSKPNGIAVIMCPGGGYSHQAINHEGHDMAAWFNAQGITYAVLKYRLPQGDPTLPLSDAEQAVRILRTHAGVGHQSRQDRYNGSFGRRTSCIHAFHTLFRLHLAP